MANLKCLLAIIAIHLVLFVALGGINCNKDDGDHDHDANRKHRHQHNHTSWHGETHDSATTGHGHREASERSRVTCDDVDDLHYELFATKTSYDDARKYLQQTDDDDWPKSFDDDKLAEEHRELKNEGCKPLVFYFVGRHSARFPDGEDIEKYNRDLNEIVAKLASSSEPSPATKNCKQRRAELVRWRSIMDPKHDNLITELGAREERDIAKRFKRIYPDFFDAERANITIGVTEKLRTAQTGAQFLSQVEGLNLTGCDTRSIPTNDVEDKDYNIKKVLEAECYKTLIEKYGRTFLEFHKECERIGGEPKVKDPRIDRIKAPELRQRIADRVGQKLGLESGAVTLDKLDSIYNVCRFENALKGDSIWCDLFDQADIEALEYIQDVSSYIKSAYGPKANPRQSCPLVKDLVEAMLEGSRSGSRRVPVKSYFYFSHADPIKKLLATFDLFRDDESFSERQLAAFERDLTVPRRRSWRTSIVTPFSANLAFVLYGCNSRGDSNYKILSTVTEQPVKMGGCSDTDCSSQRFFNTYGDLRNCDLEQVCGRSLA